MLFPLLIRNPFCNFSSFVASSTQFLFALFSQSRPQIKDRAAGSRTVSGPTLVATTLETDTAANASSGEIRFGSHQILKERRDYLQWRWIRSHNLSTLEVYFHIV
ncbi:uncharacterized protein LOC111411965 isoform X1 [Olea europaea var. sylvestris]|uniref:uncharacterized protein LOC111411965 isoform X1 n=1 Tax=Olea europaea var. sylvestris TaxID=158386 RepID=UPI000C1D18DD|nr:uncharacterized protein LOC111411965 isoform X1 [Olea europaea var. sylvestris]